MIVQAQGKAYLLLEDARPGEDGDFKKYFVAEAFGAEGQYRLKWGILDGWEDQDNNLEDACDWDEADLAFLKERLDESERMDVLISEYGKGTTVFAQSVPLATRSAPVFDPEGEELGHDHDDGKVDNHDAMSYFEQATLGPAMDALGLKVNWNGGDEGVDWFTVEGDERKFCVTVLHDVVNTSNNRARTHEVSVSEWED